jgi:hypothetical protein
MQQETTLKKPIKGYNGWLIMPISRATILSWFPPKFSSVYVHHITNQFKILDTDPLLNEVDAIIVGYAIDENGIEAAVVSVNGNLYRPDGNIYHCTLSLDIEKGFSPKDSNKLILNGWKPINISINISTQPQFFTR